MDFRRDTVTWNQKKNLIVHSHPSSRVTRCIANEQPYPKGISVSEQQDSTEGSRYSVSHVVDGCAVIQALLLLRPSTGRGRSAGSQGLRICGRQVGLGFSVWSPGALAPNEGVSLSLEASKPGTDSSSPAVTVWAASSPNGGCFLSAESPLFSAAPALAVSAGSSDHSLQLLQQQPRCLTRCRLGAAGRLPPHRPRARAPPLASDSPSAASSPLGLRGEEGSVGASLRAGLRLKEACGRSDHRPRARGPPPVSLMCTCVCMCACVLPSGSLVCVCARVHTLSGSIYPYRFYHHSQGTAQAQCTCILCGTFLSITSDLFTYMLCVYLFLFLRKDHIVSQGEKHFN